MDICIDFDGTCVTHEFPRVGKDVGAVPVLKDLVDAGHKLILFTMRSDRKTKKKAGDETIVVEENFLSDAVNWFKDNGIELYGIQKNPKQRFWTTSPKAYGHLYIDDSGLGCPLIIPAEGRPYVDWIKIRSMLEDMQIIEKK